MPEPRPHVIAWLLLYSFHDRDGSFAIRHHNATDLEQRLAGRAALALSGPDVTDVPVQELPGVLATKLRAVDFGDDVYLQVQVARALEDLAEHL